MAHPVVSKDEWLAARRDLLVREKEMTRARDRLNEARRALPWVRVDEDYAFDTPSGRRTLAQLFDGRSQLLIYHFMLAPGWEAGCEGCSFFADHIDGALQHFIHADASLVVVSRAPLDEIERYRKRMGWNFPWVSSFGSDFNYDFQASFHDEELEAGEITYNFRRTKPFGVSELHGISVFAKGEDGQVYHTYSTYARGCEQTIGTLMLLDLMPKGRNEESTMNWVRRHDEYEEKPVQGSCCH